MHKYRFVTEFEPSFPDIRKGFQKFEHIIKEDEILKEIFPKGVTHFQICRKRGFKNIKEILARSSTKLKLEEHNEQDQQVDGRGSHPCDKPCAYCTLLRKSETTEFKSRSNGQTFEIRHRITCQSENVIYMIECKECKIQDIGPTLKLRSRISNYFSHIKAKKRTCDIVNNFIDKHAET